jgi:hypothetical protein
MDTIKCLVVGDSCVGQIELLIVYSNNISDGNYTNKFSFTPEFYIPSSFDYFDGYVK